MQETLEIIKKSKQKILTKWANLQNDDYAISGLLTSDELNDHSAQLLSAVVTRLSAGDEQSSKKEAIGTLEEHLHVLSMQWSKAGLSPREIIGFVFNLKNTLLSVLQDNIRDARELYTESQKLDKFMDDMGIIIFERFIKARESEILRQTAEIDDISTPVIQLWDGIVTLPIIGTLDSSRTQVVMDELLQRIAKNNIQIAILDISGVPAVDSNVAQHLVKLVAAVKLLGAECIISGIRPEIAQTVVSLGIDLSGVTTKSSLAAALRLGLQRSQLTVVKKN